MSAWVAPSTWTNSTFTASFMNAELRDKLVWLKAALDVITASTTSDVVGATQLQVVRSGATDSAYRANVTGDAQVRYRVLANGTIGWGDGASAPDVQLSRDSALTLALNSRLLISRSAVGNFGLDIRVAGDANPRFVAQAGGTLAWGDGTSATDLSLYRSAAGTLAGPTFLSLDAGGQVRVGGTQVVGPRRTGWVGPHTGSSSRAAFDTATVTVAQLAQRVRALCEDLGTAGHGLIDY